MGSISGRLSHGRPSAGPRSQPDPQNRTHRPFLGSLKHFENSRPVDDDACLRPYKKLLVGATSSKACMDKALDFANDLSMHSSPWATGGNRSTERTAAVRFDRRP